jgi:Lrp/AsnC family transcriptional regulator for asnA, asnC and gidA
MKTGNYSGLDALDRRLLLEVDRNAREPLSTVAKRLREGRDRIEYRLKRLENIGIIQGYGVWVDIRKLGVELFKLYLRLDAPRESGLEIVEYLSRHRSVFWIAQCDGAWDLVVGGAFITSEEFHDFHLQLLSRFNTGILKFSAAHLVNLTFFDRSYLVSPGRDDDIHRNRNRRVVFPWGIRGNEKIDETDRKIISGLSRNGRAPLAKLAEELVLPEHMVRYRFERLERAGIICAHRAELGFEELGVIPFKTQLFLRSYDLDLRKQLRDYCHQNGNVIGYIEQIADANIEIELECEHHQQYHDTLNDIRNRFAKLIRSFETLVIRKTHHFRVPRVITLSG